MNTPDGTDEGPAVLGPALQEAEADVVAHLAGLEAAVGDLAERLEALGREGASSTTAALTEVLGLVRGLAPGRGALALSLRADADALRADLAGALGELGRLVGPGLEGLTARLVALEQAEQARDERLAEVLGGFSDAIGAALGRLGEQLGAGPSPEGVDLDALADRVADRVLQRQAAAVAATSVTTPEAAPAGRRRER